MWYIELGHPGMTVKMLREYIIMYNIDNEHYMLHIMLCTLQKIIQSYEYTDVLHTSPALNSIMMIVGDVAKGTKYMFQTTHVNIYIIPILPVTVNHVQL